MRLLTDLLGLAHERSPSTDFRREALGRVRDDIGAEVGFFVDAREALDTSPFVGFASEIRARLGARFPDYALEVAPVHRVTARSGAATDREVLGRALARTRLHREIVAPSGGTESLFVGCHFGGAHLGTLMIGRLGRRFTRAEREVARALSPVLSLALACRRPARELHEVAPLGPTERELLSYLKLGYSSRQIALARGTSFFTVRNQLSALYRKLGVANRTEAVGRFDADG